MLSSVMQISSADVNVVEGTKDKEKLFTCAVTMVFTS